MIWIRQKLIDQIIIIYCSKSKIWTVCKANLLMNLILDQTTWPSHFFGGFHASCMCLVSLAVVLFHCEKSKPKKHKALTLYSLSQSNSTSTQVRSVKLIGWTNIQPKCTTPYSCNVLTTPLTIIRQFQATSSTYLLIENSSKHSIQSNNLLNYL